MFGCTPSRHSAQSQRRESNPLVPLYEGGAPPQEHLWQLSGIHHISDRIGSVEPQRRIELLPTVYRTVARPSSYKGREVQRAVVSRIAALVGRYVGFCILCPNSGLAGLRLTSALQLTVTSLRRLGSNQC